MHNYKIILVAYWKTPKPTHPPSLPTYPHPTPLPIHIHFQLLGRTLLRLCLCILKVNIWKFKFHISVPNYFAYAKQRNFEVYLIKITWAEWGKCLRVHILLG